MCWNYDIAIPGKKRTPVLMTSEGASENSGETVFGQVCLVLLPHVGLVTDSTLASLLGCWSPLRADSRDVGEEPVRRVGRCQDVCPAAVVIKLNQSSLRATDLDIKRDHWHNFIHLMESEPHTSAHVPTVEDAGETASLIDRFESAYNEIDALMHKLCKLTKNDSFSVALVRYEERIRLGNEGEFLRSAAELRNVLIHRRTLPIFQMATPTKQVVERLEGIRDRMLNPPKVARYMKIVAYVSPDDSLADVMRIVFESDFSQFPVMNGKEVTGLLTENGITRWLARKIVCEDSLVESADAKVSDIVMSEEKRKNFIFVSKKMAIAEVREKFRREGMLEAALITESGKKGEKLLGMINRWDLIEE